MDFSNALFSSVFSLFVKEQITFKKGELPPIGGHFVVIIPVVLYHTSDVLQVMLFNDLKVVVNLWQVRLEEYTEESE